MVSVPRLFVCGSLAIIAAGCGTGTFGTQGSSSTRANSRATVSTDIAQSRAWRREGAYLKRKYSYAYSYESVPVNVNGPGPLLLDFGPVDSTFTLDTRQVLVYTTPSDANFGISVMGLTMTSINGQPYIEAQVGFLGSDGASPSYNGYQLWLSVQLD